MIHCEPAQMKYWEFIMMMFLNAFESESFIFGFYSNPIQEGDTENEHSNRQPWRFANGQPWCEFHLYDNNRVSPWYSECETRFTTRDNFWMQVLWWIIHSVWLAQQSLGRSKSVQLYSSAWKYHFNNLMEMKFSMNRDQINPILDVTFDGVHILDGDIVSANQPSTFNCMTRINSLHWMIPRNSKFTSRVRIPEHDSGLLLFPTYGNTMRFYACSITKNSCKIDWSRFWSGRYLYAGSGSDW